jgi:hypothetical protein
MEADSAEAEPRQTHLKSAPRVRGPDEPKTEDPAASDDH